MNLTPEHYGMLKGIVGTSLLFVAVIVVGLFLLHQKHEEEMDKLQRNTARDCLDVAAEHYERLIHR